jgi:hypothetical protein
MSHGAPHGDDDGSADPDLRAAIAAGQVNAEDLSKARLLIALLADADGEMARVSMVNAAGERGLLAFSGLDAMQVWNPNARPLPVTGAEAAQAALDDDAALVIDVLGPARCVITDAALHALIGE